MEWRKLKNIMILILLVVNGFLLVLVWSRRDESVRYQRRALERTARVLNKKGIDVHLDAAAPADGLTALTLERDLDRERQMAQGLLGRDVQADNRGGGLYLYHGGGGELTVRAGGELSAELNGGERWKTDHPERHAAGLLRDMGLEAEELEAAREGGRTRVRFRQIWNGTAVFSCEVEFVYEDGVLSAIHGTLIAAGPGTAEAGQPLNLPTALMRFSEEIAAAGDVCTVIHSMEPGYRGTAQSLSGGARLAPVWLVTTDTARYYLDCAAGGLTRVE